MDAYAFLYQIVLFWCIFGMPYHQNSVSGSVFPDRSKPPGLNSPSKLWWAKEVTPEYHVAGRLSERQIKYASEGGFESILSLFPYADKESGDFGGDYLPTTKESRAIAEKCGMAYAVPLLNLDDWCSIDAVKKIADVLPKLKKPVLLHCDRGYTITFVLLLHFANLTRHDPSFEPKFDSERFYEITARMGLDFTDSTSKEVVSEITGEPIVKSPPVTNAQPDYWLDFWLAHPVYKNWYISGQITKSDLKVMGFTGFKSVINLRSGFLLNGKPSQEEVNLLNIRDGTGTYATDKNMPRQNKERLEETRVDPNNPNSYINPDSNVNYESKNEAEFGDGVGYNADFEKTSVGKTKLHYHHFPVSDGGPWMYYFDNNIDAIIEAGRSGPVLVHSASGRRACYVAIVAAALAHGLDVSWALLKSQDLGCPMTEVTTPDILRALKKHLNRRYTRTEL